MVDVPAVFADKCFCWYSYLFKHMKQLLILLFLPSLLWGQNEAIKIDSDTIIYSGSLSNSAIQVGKVYKENIIDTYNNETRLFINAIENDDSPTTLLTFEKNAIDTLTRRLNEENLWDKFYAIYPFIGNTANSCAYNLKDPRNTDDAYRLTWSETGLKVANFISGVCPLNLYANTHFKANQLTAQDMHLSWFNRYSNFGNEIEIGAFESGDGIVYMSLDNATNKFAATFGKDNGLSGTETNSDNLGYYIATAKDSSKLFYDGQLLVKGRWWPATGYYSDDDIYLFARNSNSVAIDGYTKRGLCLRV